MNFDVSALHDHILKINSGNENERKPAEEFIELHKNETEFLHALLFLFANEDDQSSNLVTIRIQIYILLKKILWPNKLFLQKKIIEKWNSADSNIKKFIEDKSLEDIVGLNESVANNAISFYISLYRLLPDTHSVVFSMIQEVLQNEDYPVKSKYQALDLFKQICESNALIPEDSAREIYVTIYDVLMSPEIDVDPIMIDVFISFTSLSLEYFVTEAYISELIELNKSIVERYPEPDEKSIEILKKLIKHSIISTYGIDSNLFAELGTISVGAIINGEDDVFIEITECWQEIAEFEADRINQKKRYNSYIITSNLIDASGVEYPYPVPFYRGLSETLAEQVLESLIQRLTTVGEDFIDPDSPTKRAYKLIKALAKVSPEPISEQLMSVIDDQEIHENFPIVAVLCARIIIKYLPDDFTQTAPSLNKAAITEMLAEYIQAEDELLSSNALKTFVTAFSKRFIEFRDVSSFIRDLLSNQETSMYGVTLLSYGVKYSRFKSEHLPDWILRPVISALVESNSESGLFMYLEALAFHISDSSQIIHPYDGEISEIIFEQMRRIIISMKETISNANDSEWTQLGEYLNNQMDGLIKIAKNQLYLLHDDIIVDIYSLHELQAIQFWCLDQYLTLLNYITSHMYCAENDLVIELASIAGNAVESGNAEMSACGLLTLCNLACASKNPLDDSFFNTFYETIKTMNLESDTAAYVASAMCSILRSFSKNLPSEEVLKTFQEEYGMLLDMVSTTDDYEIANDVMIPVFEGFICLLRIYESDTEWLFANRMFLARPLRVVPKIESIGDNLLIAMGEYFFQVTRTLPPRALIPFSQKEMIRCLLLASSVVSSDNMYNIQASLSMITSRKAVKHTF